MAMSAEVITLHPKAPRARGAARVPAEPGQWHSSMAPAIHAFASDDASGELIGGAIRAVQILPNELGRLFLVGSLLASVVLHGVALLALQQEPKPLASIGLSVISVEIVLGSDTAAGRPTTAVAQEAVDTAGAATAETYPPETETTFIRPEPARRLEPQAAPVQSESFPQATTVEAVEQRPEDIKTTTVVAREPPRPPQRVERKQRPEAERDSRLPREAARTSGSENVKGTGGPTSVSNLGRGIGSGRSDAATNYRGLVAAHLARYKRGDLRDQGKVTITVAIDGRGNVTSVRLINRSGFASLDQEAQAMVRRASPFPPPPSGRSESFNIPLSFTVR
jgi:protein TonB